MRNLKISRILLLRTSIVALALITAAGAAAKDNFEMWRGNVSRRINALLKNEMFASSQAGIYIYDLTANKKVYSRNSKQLMRPASTQKVITAVTALDRLGAEHKITTSIRCSGEITGGVLGDTIYCRGSFDPMLSRNDILDMALRIKECGADTIRGVVIIDKSMKDNVEFGSGWCWDDDNPVLSALTADGEDNFAEVLMSAMQSAGIVFEADFQFGVTPKGTKIICSTYHTVEEVMQRMMKESDNFYAEALFYNIAASSGKAWASAKEAAEQINRLAGALGYKNTQFRIADGSGLSLYNYTTPEIETSFLKHAYRNRRIFDALYPSLPIAGIDGTLKKRMRDNRHTRGNVHAKTGTVTAVSSLAGYCKAGNGHIIAFSIINQGIMHWKDGRNFQDEVCSILCEPAR